MLRCLGSSTVSPMLETSPYLHMDTSGGVGDLHLHTTASDGTCSVADRIDQAAARDLDAVAITDHDCIADDLVNLTSSRRGVNLITGVEVRADVQNTKVEVLGYYLDPEDPQLSDVLERARRYRRERNEAMVERLNDVSPLDLDVVELRSEVDGMLGRPHLASKLVDAGVVDSIGDAFDEYLADERPAFVPMQRVPAEEVLDAIRKAGGVSSLAHPGRIRSDDVRGIVTDLVAAGLDAVEVAYPYDEAPGEGDFGVADAAALADEHGLLRTGGSDCHGPDSGKFRIGDVRVSAEQLDALRDLAGKRRPF